MFKRIAILAAAFVMLIAARRNDYDRELQTNDSREIEGRSAGSERSERADRDYPARSDRSTGSTGYVEDAAGSASERVLQRIEPVEVTYDISGIAAEVPEGTEPEEGGTDAAVEEYDWEVVDDGQYAFDGDTMHERDDLATYGGTLAEDCGTDDGSKPAEEGSEQTDGGSDLEYTGAEPDHAVDSYEAEEVEESVPEPEWNYYGNCRITFYCTGPCCCGEWSGGPTASGEEPIPYWTCANGDLPFGTHVLINGVEYCVTDRGVAGDEFDVLVGSHDEALENGIYWTDVYVRY